MIAADVIVALKSAPFRQYKDVAARSATAPRPAAGMYGWWQTPGALPGVPGTPHPTMPLELLYVGIAPKDAASSGNLRKRLANHHRAAVGSSTFRLDLAAFLWRARGWQPAWTDRVVLPPGDLAELAAWQARHLEVQWVEVSRPWDLEAEVVAGMQPPLNRDHNETHPFHTAVGVAREELRAAARATLSP